MSSEVRTTGRLREAARSAARHLPGQRYIIQMLDRIPGRESLGRRVAVNSGWLIAERVTRMVIALIVTIQIVRYLGPLNYGILAYGLSIIAIVEVVTSLGIRSTVVRELVERPEDQPEVLGTAIGLRFIVSVTIFSLIAILWGRNPDSQTLGVLTVLAAGLPLMAFAQFDLFFQANLESHYAVAGRTVALLLASLTRVAMLVAGAPLLAFAAAGAIEFAATGIAFIVLYQKRNGALRALRMNRRAARRLLMISWPLFVSAIAAVVYLKIDQVMLQHMIGSEEVGVYAAAARLSEIWYFLPIALASSLLPLLVKQRLEDERAYQSSLEHGFRVAAWVAILLAVGTTLIATPLVAVVFGSEYARTADILRVHMWAGPFIFVGTVLGRALIAEDRLHFELWRHGSGATLNVLLNIVLIPPFAGMGAALATLISYAVTSYLICFSYGPTRFHARLITRAVTHPWNFHHAS